MKKWHSCKICDDQEYARSACGKHLGVYLVCPTVLKHLLVIWVGWIEGKNEEIPSAPVEEDNYSNMCKMYSDNSLLKG